jgi:hypothetical protein
MGWDEAARLAAILLRDPSSQLAASVAGWERPWSHDWAVTADLYDLQRQSKSKRRVKPYPRPWRTQGRTFGTAVTKAEFKRIREAVVTRDDGS